MKKNRFLNNVLIVILVVCTSMFLFAGCKSKTSGNTQQDQTAAGQTNNGAPNQDQRKQQIQEGVKALVTDGTINQSQADKIVEALTSGNFRGNGSGRGQNGGQNGQQNSGQGSGQTNGQNSTQNNGQNSSQNGSQGGAPNNPQGNNNRGPQGNGQGRQFNNPLSKLVTDGVITQAQADAVIQKVMGGFQRPQGGQNGQGPQGNQGSQSGQSGQAGTTK